MNLLALDTATDSLSLALRYKGELITREWQAQQRHAELALPEIMALLADAGASLKALDGIALSVGPGSFTGLRIGCGIAQGLAFGLDIPALGVNTLAAMAADRHEDAVLVALDARMGELYLAAFCRNAEGWDERVTTRVCRPDDLPDLPDLPDGRWLGVGSGFVVHAERLTQRYEAALSGVDAAQLPHARGVLALAEPQFLAGLAKPADQLELVYIRDKVALKTSERVAQGMKA
ncbi:tRNA (adenosine(37)-N6)-threonylcarbamoyltransferase complex dimerization subunit type 1 TsaB [Chitinimonas sp. BJYL2]|uniref:tRNA (adenosine(37)-N6)-threonylcarbamoyltransferase complex dimerization subunit type 1 TsaB n=1 Tax=Chitinimonas sp. BJYL2 TaxID=2976696 RepID=UPI0022B2DD05|nr:tRNA (adenosine(37)-N6)-threonylcarbamoyltransferase complex dimerization subunit type 1 TsaB [Chitinimonas sp. BJYL2]